MRNKLIKKIIVSTLIIAILSSLLSVFVFASGDESSDLPYLYEGLSGDDIDLESETNTQKNADGTFVTPVTEAEPQITFLIHGLGGNASHWSNDYYQTQSSSTFARFAYNEDSIIELLREQTLGKVYLAKSATEYELDDWSTDGKSYIEGTIKAGTTQQFKMYELYHYYYSEETSEAFDLDIQYGIFEKTEYLSNKKAKSVTRIDDISNHIIVVFEAYDPSASNRQVYEEFNYVADKIIYDIKYLNDGVLPKINLIGHSRGGLTAMQYALEHPYLVDSLFTLGTPFEGSTLAYDSILSKLGMSTDPNAGIKFSFGVKDVLDEGVYNSYRNRWNEGYEEKYSHINFHPIGSYATLEAISKIIVESPEIEEFLPSWADDAASAANMTLDIMQLMGRGWLVNHTSILGGDLFVHVLSQLAQGYTGADRYLRVFTEHSMDLDMRAVANVPIPHNLEPGDSIIHSYILDNISLGVNFDYTFNPKHYKAYTTNGVFSYPAVINDIPTEEIPAFAFDGIDDITSVIIPASVKKIGRSAFENCPNLTSVTFAEGSQLEEIGDNAFAGCVELDTINLGDELKTIGEFAFAGTAINYVNIGEKVEEIGVYAFLDADIIDFYVSHANVSFNRTSGGALFTEDMTTLIAFPAGSTNAYFAAPTQMTTIAPGAFYNAKSLVRVDLGSLVTRIPENAFCGCEALGEIIAPNVSSVVPLALENTAFMESEQPIKSLGTVFIKYTGNDETVSISGYDVISSYAFEGCTSLKSIKISGTSLYIQPFAFSDCVDLTEVYLEYYSPVRFDKYAFLPDTVGRKIYVNNQAIDEYTADGSRWESYRDEFVVYEGKITFDSGEGTEVEALTVECGDRGILLPEPQKPHYHFVGWSYDPSDETEFVGTMFNAYSEMIPEIKLYAVWEPTIYTLYLETEGGTIPGNEYGEIIYTVEDAIELPIPTREGYIFVGWKNSEGKYVTGFPVGTHGDVTLTAEWDAIEYEVELFNGNTYIDTIIATYEDRSHIEELISVGEENAPNGYYFDGWYYITDDGRHYVISVNSEESTSIDISWDFVNYNVLYADYKPERYYLTIEDKESGLFSIGVNSNGSITPGSNGDGFDYGQQFSEYQVFINTFKSANIEPGYILTGFSIYKTDNNSRSLGEPIRTYLLTDEFNVTDFGDNGETFCVVPNYEAERYRIIIDVSGNLTTLQNAVTVLDTLDFLPLPTKTGYTFAGWQAYRVSENGDIPLLEEVDPSDYMFDCDANNENPDLSNGEPGITVKFVAVFSANTYHYVLHKPDGTTKSGSITYGTSDYIFELPVTKAYYSFVGWYTGQNGTGTKYSDSSGNLTVVWNATSTVDLYPYYKPIEYSITYVANGGTHSNTTTKYTVESTISLQPASKSGYRFIGWYIGTEPVSVIKNKTGNLTLTAKFEKLYTITFIDGTTQTVFEGIREETITAPGNLHKSKLFVAQLGQNTITLEGGAQYTIGDTDLVFTAREKTLNECLVNGVYEIYTESQLNSIRSVANSTSTKVLLKADINLTGSWTCIDTWKGTFDGDGRMIAGLEMIVSGTPGAVGMFGTNLGTIKNLMVYGSSLKMENNFGTTLVCAGMVVGINKGVLYNVGASSCTLTVHRTESNVGGVVGKNNQGTMTECFAWNIELDGYGDIGLLTGVCYGGSISGANVQGNETKLKIYGTNKSAGCLVGYAAGGCSISNCDVYQVNLKFVGYSEIEKKDLKPCMGYLVGNLDGSGTSIVNSQAYSVSKNISNLPAAYSVLFKKYNPRERAFAVANGAIGYVSNGATYSNLTVTEG